MYYRVCLLVVILATTLTGCVITGAEAANEPTSSTTSMPRTIAAMQPKLTQTLTPSAAEQLFGKPDEITGSGLLIYVYNMANGQKLWLGFSGYRSLFYAKVRNSDGSMQDLPLK
ncbi:MAG: hypothetical protein H0X37_02490 [Herpetosiphonaceae bacterium]|nr:hypothetical protein [Herpetosiphonaceae bacterium]